MLNMQNLTDDDDSLPLHCLDLNIYYRDKDECYATLTHDKRDDPKFANLPFTKYKRPLFIHDNIPYNIITTEQPPLFGPVEVLVLLEVLVQMYCSNHSARPRFSSCSRCVLLEVSACSYRGGHISHQVSVASLTSWSTHYSWQADFLLKILHVFL